MALTSDAARRPVTFEYVPSGQGCCVGSSVPSGQKNPAAQRTGAADMEPVAHPQAKPAGHASQSAARVRLVDVLMVPGGHACSVGSVVPSGQ